MHTYQRWRDAIQAARDLKALQRAMADYVQTIPAAVIDALPPECHHALRHGDIQSTAVCLLQYELAFKGEPAVAQQLHEAAHTFAAAATRMTWFNHEPIIASGQ